MSISQSLLPPSTPSSVTSVTGTPLSDSQHKAIDCLIDRGPDENLDSVAKRAGVTRMTLWRWLRKSEFVAEIKARTEANLGSYRPLVAAALVRGALREGNGQAAMQKIYWQRLGELTEKSEISGHIEVDNNHSLQLDQLPPEGKIEFIELIDKYKLLQAKDITPTNSGRRNEDGGDGGREQEYLEIGEGDLDDANSLYTISDFPVD